MWADNETMAFRTTHAEFRFTRRTFDDHGRWRFCHRVDTRNRVRSWGIWHTSMPLKQLRNTSTSFMIDLFENELERCHNPYSRQPIGIISNTKLMRSGQCGGQEDLGTTMECIIAFGRKFDTLDKNNKYKPQVPYQPLIRFTADCTNGSYPEPDLGSIYTNPSHRRASMLILRHPTKYDGDTAFTLQRYMRPALRLLFAGMNANITSDPERDCQSNTANQTPSLVVFEGKDFTTDVSNAMAQAVYPTLTELLRLYEEKIPLPSHCFVYGIHLSPLYLTLCLHFPTKTTNHKTKICGWEFRQVVAARYLLACEPNPENLHENLILLRWRLLISLFTVLKHVQLLGTLLPHKTTESHDHVPNPCLRICRPRNSAQTRFDFLRRAWDRSRLRIPSEWTTPVEREIDSIAAEFLYETDIGRDLLPRLASLLMNTLRRHIVLISPSAMLKNHVDPEYRGPDFLIPLHCPLNQFCKTGREEMQDRFSNTHAHMYRTYDFVQLSTSGWHEFNILVAKLFSGFAYYTVQWNPIIRYPFSLTLQSSDMCVVDFALAVCAIPATNKITIERARDLPLTVSSPAVLVGCHSKNLDSEGDKILQDEMNALIELMRPHLQLFDLYTRYPTSVRNTVAIDAHPYLFCTYIKPGFLHILAFRLGATDHTVESYLVDSLPLMLDCQNADDMRDRLHAAVALFTLQNEVVKICEAWGAVSWPVEVLADEHEAIMEVTGVCSPTPTESIPELYEQDEWLMIPCTGNTIEDDPEYIAQQVAKSTKRVTSWLAQLEAFKLPLPHDALVLDSAH